MKLDRQTGEIRAWAQLEVVDTFPNNDQITIEKAKEKYPDVQLGDVVEWEVTPKNFGRIAAQTARQAILQQLRKAEKAIVKEEYDEKVGEIVNGTVKRIEAGAIIVDLQKSEGIIAAKDKVPGEQYMVGERINALLVKVDTLVSGPSLILSRSNPGFVKNCLNARFPRFTTVSLRSPESPEKPECARRSRSGATIPASTRSARVSECAA